MRARAALTALGVALAVAGCTQETVTVDVRSLERSGRSAFVCLNAPAGAPADERLGRQITDCSRRTAPNPEDFGVDAEAPEADRTTTLPHLYALVTQTTRGEVAVVDLTTEESPVLDQDPGVPGANFLPVGAQPIDIVATQGGTAAFVTVAEIGREGIFALPASRIRPDDAVAPPRLSSWPACRLPSAPGDLVIVSDPPGPGGEQRASCDGALGAPGGALAEEGLGRQKLVVTMPELGGFVVIDAQELLDRPLGAYDDCTVERWVPLQVELPPPPVAPAPAPHGPECVEPEQIPLSVQPLGAPRPAGVAFTEGRLYIADLDAPVVHVVDMPSPCAPVERPPLLPSSLDEPERLVTTSRVAVSPGATPDFRRYLYAVDAHDGSVMFFDVSDDATTRAPLARPRPEWNPFLPPDRVRYRAPVRDLVIVQRDVPAQHPTIGVAPEGVRCDPDPSLTPCDANTTSCDVETLYRTDDEFEGGAGPRKLRGTFAFLVLTSGQVAIVDIDDLDAQCRAPRVSSVLGGCPPLGTTSGATSDDIDGDGHVNADDNCPFQPNPDQENSNAFDPDDENGDGNPIDPSEEGNELPNDKAVGDACSGSCPPGVDAEFCMATSGEVSCNVVIPHTPRDADYLLTADTLGRHEPGVQTYPLLYDPTGTVIPLSEASPKMRVTVDAQTGARPRVSVGAGTAVVTDQGLAEREDKVLQHAIAMNLEDPRAHVVDQAWTVTYEGVLPGFGRTVAELRVTGAPDDGVYAADARFCDRGVQSEESVKDQLALWADAGDPDPATPEGYLQLLAKFPPAEYADYVLITTELLAESNGYWQTAPRTYQDCVSLFGTTSAPTDGRRLRIKEAFQDHVLVEPRTSGFALGDIDACFSSQIQFEVRGGSQWIVQGESQGFLHHVIDDPETGRCRNSCDPRLARMNGRVIPGPPLGEVVRDGDAPYAFINPMFRFSINHGFTPGACDDPTVCPSLRCDAEQRCLDIPAPDTRFFFVTQGGFGTLVIDLAAETNDLQPQAIRFIPATGELAITDGSLEGLILISPTAVDVSRQFF